MAMRYMKLYTWMLIRLSRTSHSFYVWLLKISAIVGKSGSKSLQANTLGLIMK